VRSGLLGCIAVAIACAWTLSAADARDGAVVAALRGADASLSVARVWHRVDVGDDLDLVIVLGSARPFYASGYGERIGLFLQRQHSPGTVYQLAVAPSVSGCGGSIARATRTDTIIWCEGEKFLYEPARKFVYDVRAKRLVADFEFEPFTHITARPLASGQLALTATSRDRRARVRLSPPATFTVTGVEGRPQGAPVVRDSADVVGRRFGPERSFQLVEIPDSEADDCGSVIAVASGTRRYRPPVKDCGAIGPSHEVGERLWFGRTFYDGEAWSGVGGFGYFDTSARRFEMFTSPAIRPWSTSAIHVSGDSVWVALESRGEYWNSPGGVLVYPTPNSPPRRIDIGRCVGREFVASGEHLYLLTECGIVLFTQSGVSGFMVDVTSDNRVRVVPGMPSIVWDTSR
jgi:hypothetical protein